MLCDVNRHPNNGKEINIYIKHIFINLRTCGCTEEFLNLTTGKIKYDFKISIYGLYTIWINES